MSSLFFFLLLPMWGCIPPAPSSLGLPCESVFDCDDGHECVVGMCQVKGSLLTERLAVPDGVQEPSERGTEHVFESPRRDLNEPIDGRHDGGFEPGFEPVEPLMERPDGVGENVGEEHGGEVDAGVDIVERSREERGVEEKGGSDTLLGVEEPMVEPPVDQNICVIGAMVSCYSGDPKTRGVGVCVAGMKTCLASGMWSVCQGERLPSKDLCGNGLDEDCDGVADKGCVCNPGSKEKCGSAVGLCVEGSRVCDVQGQWGVCVGGTTAQPEVCDGKDNNCDGQVDEKWPGLSGPCSDGVGECLSQGVYVCKADGSGVECNALAKPASVEVCDGKDNDCDGQTDEGLSRYCYDGASGTAGKGLCQNGTQSCLSGGWGTCVGQVLPHTEVCDGKDNDCDGQIDEGVTRSCFTGGTGCASDGTQCVGACKPGVQTCVGGVWSTTCVGEVLLAVESCNGVDDDCDGVIDESWPDKGKVCTKGLGECVSTGKYLCKLDGTGLMCNALVVAPGIESCNGLDDDCDGSVDEDWSTKGNTCKAGVGGCEKSGVFVCNAGKTGVVCNAVAGQPVKETCNFIDDDCDGKVDNIATPEACTYLDGGGLCRNSHYVCSGNDKVCEQGAIKIPQACYSDKDCAKCAGTYCKGVFGLVPGSCVKR